MVAYFWDTYAIIELLAGNPRYARFANEPVVLCIFNLTELYWAALLRYSKSEAVEIFEHFRPAVVELDDETLKAAIEFRHARKKDDLSYADCIGYIFARRHGMRFLTGDQAFSDIEGVEYVK